jgi:release factor glutamine methyltransferase
LTAAELLAGTDLPEHEARRLLLAATGLDASGLVADPTVDARVVAIYRAYVARRRSGEPLQYIEGDVEFGPISLRVDPRALIPRPETEHLYEFATEVIAGLQNPTIIDLCTGSGNIALALKSGFPRARVIGTDLSSEALSLAAENAAALDLSVELVEGDLFAGVHQSLLGKVDLVVSNPPYVASGEWASLPREVRDHEPEAALVAGPQGTEVLARIAGEAYRWLRPGGRLICEIGETQEQECLRLFSAYRPRVRLDLTGRPRYVHGIAPQSPNVH